MSCVFPEGNHRFFPAQSIKYDIKFRKVKKIAEKKIHIKSWQKYTILKCKDILTFLEVKRCLLIVLSCLRVHYSKYMIYGLTCHVTVLEA